MACDERGGVVVHSTCHCKAALLEPCLGASFSHGTHHLDKAYAYANLDASVGAWTINLVANVPPGW